MFGKKYRQPQLEALNMVDQFIHQGKRGKELMIQQNEAYYAYTDSITGDVTIYTRRPRNSNDYRDESLKVHMSNLDEVLPVAASSLKAFKLLNKDAYMKPGFIMSVIEQAEKNTEFYLSRLTGASNADVRKDVIEYNRELIQEMIEFATERYAGLREVNQEAAARSQEFRRDVEGFKSGVEHELDKAETRGHFSLEPRRRAARDYGIEDEGVYSYRPRRSRPAEHSEHNLSE